jgi:hypothetical protein
MTFAAMPEIVPRQVLDSKESTPINVYHFVDYLIFVFLFPSIAMGKERCFVHYSMLVVLLEITIHI